jgi:hypothetical protein
MMCNTSIAPLSQRDARWAKTLLGNSNVSTIGAYGCLITSMAMLAGLTPDVLNLRMKPRGFQPAGSSCEACAATFDVQKFAPSAPALMRATQAYPYTPFPKPEIAQLVAHLREGRPAILEVDMVPYPRNNQHDQHFVLAVAAFGHDGAEQIVINDPWFGDQVTLSPRYGTTLAAALVRVIYYA